MTLETVALDVFMCVIVDGNNGLKWFQINLSPIYMKDGATQRKPMQKNIYYVSVMFGGDRQVPGSKTDLQFALSLSRVMFKGILTDKH